MSCEILAETLTFILCFLLPPFPIPLFVPHQALMAAGLTHIDTAEVYGYGKSEEFLGEFIREAGVQDSVQVRAQSNAWGCRDEAAHTSLHLPSIHALHAHIQSSACAFPASCAFTPEHLQQHVACALMMKSITDGIPSRLSSNETPAACALMAALNLQMCVPEQIATKFAPYPWRLTADSVPAALKASLARLQLPKASLYMIHW